MTLPDHKCRKNWFDCDTEQGLKVRSPMGSLPLEIITEILARLPIESLLLLKSVNKTWRDEIDNPQFSVRHLSKFLATPSSSFVMLPHFRADIYIVEEGANTSKIKFSYSDTCDQTKVRLYLLGSCNGLVCISSLYFQWNPRDFVSICNPITGESYVLPDSKPLDGVPIKLDFGSLEELDVASGFGFDTSSNKFKMVLMFCFSSPTTPRQRKVQVYTPGANSWKTTMHTEGGDIQVRVGRGPGIFLSGSLHWLDRMGIVTFDLMSESFGSIPTTTKLLSMFSDQSNNCLKLGSLGGHLCISSDAYCDNHHDIWVLKDDNAWTKQFVISKNTPVPDLNVYVRHITPTSYKTKGKELILLCNGEFLVSYNAETGKATPIEDNVLPKRNGYSPFFLMETFPFVRSLMSPHPLSNNLDGEHRKRNLLVIKSRNPNLNVDSGLIFIGYH